ncbi:MAG: ABC transporter permease subunit [Spirochaetales bacterium]|nr:ABC transporter permease subunit [Spirochaetales bacterium]
MFLTTSTGKDSPGEGLRSPALLPLLLPGGLILGGFLFTLLQSFNLFNPLTGTGPGWEAYRTVLGDRLFWTSLFFTLRVSFASALLSTALGFLLALWFTRLRGLWKKTALLYKVFLILPHISVAYLAILFFSQTGILSSLLFRAGWIGGYGDFPVLIFDNQGRGILLGYLIKEVPFALLMISALLENIPGEMIASARMLGGSGLFIARKLLFPQALPAIGSSFFILFLYTFGAFEMPFILGGSRPVMLSIAVYDRLFRQDFSHRAEAMVLLIMMALVNLLSIVILLKLRKLTKGGTP